MTTHAANSRPTIGVLALQGDFTEHIAAVRDAGAAAIEVRLPRDLEAADALIIPGGESTTITRLLAIYDLLEPTRERGAAGMPIWGTCAGAIVLANADLKDKKSMKDIESSAVPYKNTVWHFVRVDD